MYNDHRGFVDSQDNQKDFNEKYLNKDSGPFLGTVKVTEDPLKMGRLGVNIPNRTGTLNPTPGQLIWCQYLSPFYGAKSLQAVSKTDPYTYKDTQQAYGMWAVPPDVDTTVLVIFAKGDTKKETAFWIGCVQDPFTNNSVPGHGASDRTAFGAGGTDFATDTKTRYGTEVLPAGEINRRLSEDPISALEQWKYPVNDVLAEQLLKQGLVQDTVRGTTSSSARRESPSRVFGISTPGRIRPNSATPNIGVGGRPVATDRLPGHTLVMDDGDDAGENQQTRLRTASGHQLLLNDTDGVVYLANGSGKAFIEMEKDGTINVYSDAGINLRTKQDFNIHSDRNIQFHAKQNIRFTSENNLNLNAENYLHLMGESGVMLSSQGGSVRSYGRDGITSFTPGSHLVGAAGRVDLSAGQVHFNSRPPSSSWGPSWLTPSHPRVGIKVTNGLIDIDSDQPISQGKANRIPNKTTVSDFVTHEPYQRTSSSQRKKQLINEMMADIQAENPELSADELSNIKSQLLSQDSVTGVSKQLSRIVNLNDKINLNVNKLKSLKSRAENIENEIKQGAMNFIQGQISSAVSAVRKYFNF